MHEQCQTVTMTPGPLVANLGSLNIDHVYRVPHTVRPGETLPSLALTSGPGGKGFNQSVALARAGARCTHLGLCSRRTPWLRERLAAEGVDVSRLLWTGLEPGHAIIQVGDDGQNSIVLHAGSNQGLEPVQIPSLFDGLPPGSWFLAQNETSCVAEALAEASHRGLTVCFNPAPLTPDTGSLPLDTVDWLLVNETEGAGLSGKTSPGDILQELARRCPRSSIVLTLGPEGARTRLADGTLLSTPAPRVDAVDTTAAGDTFAGYLIASLVCGVPPADALDRACRAAARTVLRPGAADSIPFASELNP
jgi:ribokinase